MKKTKKLKKFVSKKKKIIKKKPVTKKKKVVSKKPKQIKGMSDKEFMKRLAAI